MLKCEFTPLQLSHYLLHPENLKDLTEEQVSQLVLIFRFERLLATFSERCKHENAFANLSDSVKRHLNNASLLAERQRQQVFIEADFLHESLSKESPDYLFLKGAAYSLSCYQVGIGRTYSDIDILVNKESLLAIERRLILKGWFRQMLSDYDEKYYRRWAHEIPPLIHSERFTIIDIHHNFVPPVSGRAPNVNAFLKLRKSVNGYPVLAPSAMLVHSSVHLIFNEDFKHSYRDLFDLKAIIDEHTNEVFWHEAISLSKESNFSKELFLAMRYCHYSLQVDVPPSVEQMVTFSKVKLALYDFIFCRALAPSHPRCKIGFKSLATFLAWSRGHWIKMPLPVLLYHFSVKLIRSVLESLFGKHIFIKQDVRQNKR